MTAKILSVKTCQHQEKVSIIHVCLDKAWKGEKGFSRAVPVAYACAGTQREFVMYKDSLDQI